VVVILMQVEGAKHNRRLTTPREAIEPEKRFSTCGIHPPAAVKRVQLKTLGQKP
jgi:hypothetical protein